MKQISYKRRAQYFETDKMSIIHHSNYIRYFEEARMQFMHDIGCDVREIESLGIAIPNVDAYAKYIKPIKFFDDFTVNVRLAKFNGVSFEFEYEIYLDESETLAATGHTMHCFATEDSLKPFSVKHKHKDIYSKMMACVTE